MKRLLLSGSALLLSLLLSLLLGQFNGKVQAQTLTDLEAKFSCSQTRQEDGEGERLIYADQAQIQIKGAQILALQWESSLFRSSHGHECSIDSSDEPLAEVTEKGWRISLKDAVAARQRRGYDTERGSQCSIRLERDGEQLRIKPSCPTLCGSRNNFSALTVNLQTGVCHYDE
ncbi:hypothetical protein [Undibacterium sp. Ren11W]|uniref:hypothetical protein n=1 Tax=Undibacterium sp. Ren11W TaxID=3413045 RepID=UPI003BF01A93